MAAAIEIVELRFRDGIVDVDRGNQKPVFLMHLVKTMHAGGGLFRDAAPILHDLVPAVGILAMNLEQQIFDDLLFLVRRFRFGPIASFFEFITFVNEQRGIAAVIDYKLRSVPIWMGDCLISAPPIFFEALAFPRENRHARLGDGRGGVILR